MSDSDKPKDIIDKIDSYNEARKKWVKSGKPLRSKKEILEIYENICKKCPSFDKGLAVSTCKECGCRLSTDRTSFNKIAMASEHCPLNKWPGDEKVEGSSSLKDRRNPPEPPAASGGGCGCGARP